MGYTIEGREEGGGRDDGSEGYGGAVLERGGLDMESAI